MTITEALKQLKEQANKAVDQKRLDALEEEAKRSHKAWQERAHALPEFAAFDEAQKNWLNAKLERQVAAKVLDAIDGSEIDV